MKSHYNQKGLTLLEMLGTIVVLTIIATITTPLVLNFIKNVRKNTFKATVMAIARAAQDDSYVDDLKGQKQELAYIYNNYIETSNISGKALEYTGKKPKYGSIIITIDGKISYRFYDGLWCATKENNDNQVKMEEKTQEECITSYDMPEITLVGDKEITLDLNGSYTELGYSAKSYTNQDLTSLVEVVIKKNNNVVTSIDTSKIGEYKIYYGVRDGEKYRQVDRTIKIVDKTAPTLIIPDSTVIAIEDVPSFNPMDGVSATDNSGELLDIKISGNISAIQGDYKVTYTVTDKSGNVTTKERIVKVIDAIPPTIVLDPNGNNTWAKTQTTKITAADSQSQLNLTSLKYIWTTSTTEPEESAFVNSYVNNGNIVSPNNLTGDYYLYAMVKDTAENKTVIKSNIFKLDNTPPTLIVPEDVSMVYEDVASFNVMNGVFATDNSGNTPTVISSSNVSSIPGTYKITYTATDSSGNVTIKTRNIIIRDSDAPVITITGANPYTTYVGQTYTDLGATATDNVDGDVTSKIVINSTVSNIPGTYTVTYTVTDNAGNMASIIRTVYVVDNIAPEIVIAPNSNDSWVKSYSVKVTVSDNVGVSTNSLRYVWSTSTTAPDDSNYVNSFTNGGNITTPSGATGNYYLYVTAKDTSNNATYLGSGLFKLDNTAPVLTVPADGNLSIDSVTGYNVMSGVSATDNSGETVTITSSGTLSKALGTYKITYTATDPLGNSVSKVRTIIVVDVTKPVMSSVTLKKSDGSTYTSGTTSALPVIAYQSATDNVGIAKYIYSHDNVTYYDMPTNWNITWDGNWLFYVKAVDTSGNVSNNYISYRLIISQSKVLWNGSSQDIGWTTSSQYQYYPASLGSNSSAIYATTQNVNTVSWGGWRTVNPINLTGYSRIYVKGQVSFNYVSTTWSKYITHTIVSTSTSITPTGDGDTYGTIYTPVSAVYSTAVNYNGNFEANINIAGLSGNYYIHLQAYSYVSYGTTYWYQVILYP